MTELSSTLTAPPGGVMTGEVGVITGELELRTVCADQLHDPRDHQPLHTMLANVLNRPHG